MHIVRLCLIYALHRPVTSPLHIKCLCVYAFSVAIFSSENNRKTRNAAQSFQLKEWNCYFFFISFFLLYRTLMCCVFFSFQERKKTIIIREEEAVSFFKRKLKLFCCVYKGIIQHCQLFQPVHGYVAQAHTHATKKTTQKVAFTLCFSFKKKRRNNDGSMRWKEMPFTTFFSNADPLHKICSLVFYHLQMIEMLHPNR